MFKGVYSINRYTGKLKTSFHKKYYVFDGLGSFHFDTLVEARAYVTIKSEQLKNLFDSSRSIYKALSSCYMDKLLKFRISESTNHLVNSILRDCLESYAWLSKYFFPQYALAKVKYIYQCFIRISKVLKMKVLENTITKLYDSFFVEYPRYMGENKQITKTKILTNEKRKCII